MSRNYIPNTKIEPGNLTYGELEKISMACSDCSINIDTEEKDKNLIIDSINKTNKKLDKYDYQNLIFSPKGSIDGCIYLDIKININKFKDNSVGEFYKLQEKFNKKLLDYLFYKKVK